MSRPGNSNGSVNSKTREFEVELLNVKSQPEVY